MNLLAERLQNLLDKNNIKPAALAKAIDVNKSTISRILSSSAVPSVDTMFKVATFFNVKMEYFMMDKSCAETTFNSSELELIDAYRQLPTFDQQEIAELIQFKLARSAPIKGEPKEMVKSTTSVILDEAGTDERLA